MQMREADERIADQIHNLNEVSIDDEEEEGQAENLSSGSALVEGVINLDSQVMKKRVAALVNDFMTQQQRISGEDEQATAELCEIITQSMIQFLEANLSQNSLAVEEFARILQVEDSYDRKEYFAREYGDDLVATPSSVKEKLKDKPKK